VQCGNLIKYEPGFFTVSHKRMLSTKGFNLAHQVSPARAFKHSPIRTLPKAHSKYLTTEQAKQESYKSYTAKGPSLMSEITPILTRDQVL